ncbi:MAG: GH1 family beta-glucosidase [Actinomycetota bacterium]|nr:GH1 family beta-glucosidase [Actinomycetota bacterium]
MTLRFPEGFLWGAATSAYQIEGGADEGGRGPSIWDTFSHTPGRVQGGDTGDIAADHYHRYRADVDLMASIGLNAYRFSVSWPRVIPDGDGAVNQQGLDFYRRLVDALVEADIEPLVTLYHWDLPQALQDRGGWLRRQTAFDFARYAEVVFDALHDRVTLWSTLNEPYVAAHLGHYAGWHAPGTTDVQAMMTAQHHLLLGHGAAVAAMRSVDPTRRQGIVLNLEIPVATSDSPAVLDGTRRVEGLLDRSFTDPVLEGRYPSDVIADLAPAKFPVEAGDLEVISAPLDWFGVNYYRQWFITEAGMGDLPLTEFPGCGHVSATTAGQDTTDMGWPVTPRGLSDVLTWLDDRYPGHPPFMVTENGGAFDDPVAEDGTIDDRRRIDYLHSHLTALHQVIDGGIEVGGYFVWSLLDNFEWAAGYSKRFGLYHVDHQTLTRTPRNSARWYAKVIAANGVEAAAQ